MNVNPHLQYLQQQQTQQNSGNALSPQMAQLQMQQQRQFQQQRQQILSQQLHQQQQQQGPHAQGNTHLGGPNNQQNVGTNANLGGAMNGGGGIGYGQTGTPSALLQMQQQLSQQRYGNPALQQNVPNQQNVQNVHQNVPNQQNQQQNQQQLHMQMAPQMAAVPPQVPIIKEVWNFNLEHEFHALRAFINDKTQRVFILIHQEIPGIVARPVGTFKLASDYHFQTLRLNLDLLNLIQLSFCVVKVRQHEVTNSVIWQFNFHYDLTQEMFNEEHLAMLALTLQINFASHMSQGIPHIAFAELMMESGLLLDPSINWLSYHLGYDLGFLVSLLTNDILPNDEADFFWWCAKYFPNFYDLKHIGNQLLTNPAAVGAAGVGPGVGPGGGPGKSGANQDHGLGPGMNSPKTPAADMAKGILSNNKPSIEYLAEELHLLPILPVIRQYFTSQSMNQFAGHHQNQQMTSTLHAYLLMECFKELWRQANSDLSVFEKFKGYLWGLGDVLEGARAADAAAAAINNNDNKN